MNNNELVYLCREDESKLDRYLSSGLISIAQYNQVKIVLDDQELKQMALLAYQADNPQIVNVLQKKAAPVLAPETDDENEVRGNDPAVSKEELMRSILGEEVNAPQEVSKASGKANENVELSKEELMRSILADEVPNTNETKINEAKPKERRSEEPAKKKKFKKLFIILGLLVVILIGGLFGMKAIMAPKETSTDTSKTKEASSKPAAESTEQTESKTESATEEAMKNYSIEPQTLTTEQVAARDRLIANSEIKVSDISDSLITEFVEGVDAANVTATYLAITPNKNYYVANLGGEQNDTLIMEITKENGEIVADNGFTSEKLAYMENESDEIGQTYSMDYPEAVRDFKSSIDDNQNQYNALESEYNKIKYDYQLFMIKEDENSKVTSLSSKLNVIDGYMYNKNIAILNSDGSKYNSNLIADSNDLGLFGIASSDTYEVKDVLNSFFTNPDAGVNYVPVSGTLAELGGDLSSASFYYDQPSNQLLMFDASLANVTSDTCTDIKYYTIDLDDLYVISKPTKGKYYMNIQEAVDKAMDGQISKSSTDTCSPISNVKLSKDLIDAQAWSAKVSEL